MTRTFPEPTPRLLWGAAASGVGATVLNVVTYGDMLVRGRLARAVPAKAAGIIADRFGLTPLSTDNKEPQAANQREAAGALLDYVTGVGIGAACGLGRGDAGAANRAGTGVLLGLAAMVAPNAPIALTGTSDPRSWSLTDWLSDLVPHLAYGFATMATLKGRWAG